MPKKAVGLDGDCIEITDDLEGAEAMQVLDVD